MGGGAVSAVRPFFSYFGGKWRDAKHYPSPIHGTIVEPFAGSAGYSLRHASRKVILCDLDPVIVGVWRYLLRVTPAEVLSLPDLPDGGGSVDDLPLCQEARWLIGFWLNRGTTHPCKRPSAWMRRPDAAVAYPGSFWGERVRRRIAEQVEVVRHWQVFESSYEDCPVTAPATWFVDPPYQEQGHRYAKGSAGIDFAALGAWVAALPGQAIACEQEGADWLPFEPFKATKTSRKGKTSAEVVWTKGCGGQIPLIPSVVR